MYSERCSTGLTSFATSTITRATTVTSTRTTTSDRTQRRASSFASVGLALVLAWTTFLAGGVYTWVWLPALVAILLLAAAVRPRVVAERGRAVDVMLIAVL